MFLKIKKYQKNNIFYLVALKSHYKNRRIVDVSMFLRFLYGANEVVIYNFLALLTIDTNINQFIYKLTDFLIKIKKFYQKKIAKICFACID